MTYENVNFNEEWLRSKSIEEILIEFSGEGYNHIFPDDPNREKKLREVHGLANGIKKRKSKS